MVLEKITSLSWVYQLLILVGIAGLMVGGVEYLYFRDMTQEIDDQLTTLAVMKSDLANVAQVEKRHREFKLQNADLERQLRDMKIILPFDRDVDVLIRQLQDIAQACNVRLLRLAAKQVTSKEAPGPAPAPGKPAPEAPPQMYVEIALTLELTGSYSGATMFFDRVAHLPRIVTVNDLAIAGVADANKAHLKVRPTTKLLGETVGASCTLTTYFQVGQ
jgi:Tfp pilus assembly protein PilO